MQGNGVEAKGLIVGPVCRSLRQSLNSLHPPLFCQPRLITTMIYTAWARKIWFAALLFLLTAHVANADIVYTLVGQSASGFTATGTITTDGTIGVLSDTNIVSTAIFVDGNGAPSIAAPVDDFFGVTATATTLNWDASSGDVFIGSPPINSWNLSYPPMPGGSASLNITHNGSTGSVLAGPGVFAVAIPEPSSFMFLGCIAGLVSISRRRHPSRA